MVPTIKNPCPGLVGSVVRVWPPGKAEAVGSIWVGTSLSFFIPKSCDRGQAANCGPPRGSHHCALIVLGASWRPVAEDDLGLRPEPSGRRPLEEGGFGAPAETL